MKYTYNFSLRKGKLPDSAYVMLRISWNANRITQLTGLSIPPKYWVNDAQCFKPSYRNGKVSGAALNKRLNDIGAFVDKTFLRFEEENTIPTADDIKNECHRFFGSERKHAKNITFFDRLKEFTTVVGNQNDWSNSTYQKFKTLYNHLFNYDPSLTFSSLTEEHLQDFVSFLHAQGLRNTSASKLLNNLRWFLRWATKKGYNKNMDYDSFRPKMKGISDLAHKEITYLEWNELMDIYNFDFRSVNRPGLNAIRDVFCFCCFTGLRYSDVAKLKHSDVHEEYISVVTQKTTDVLTIDLNKYAHAILDKYEGLSFRCGKERDLVLPVITNQVFNKELKDMARFANIDTPTRRVYFRGSERIDTVNPKYKLITSHCARRTFVVNSLRLGIPAEVIMKWTGHSDFESMKPYIAIVDELKKKSMEKWNK